MPSPKVLHLFPKNLFPNVRCKLGLKPKLDSNNLGLCRYRLCQELGLADTSDKSDFVNGGFRYLHVGKYAVAHAHVKTTRSAKRKLNDLRLDNLDVKNTAKIGTLVVNKTTSQNADTAGLFNTNLS